MASSKLSRSLLTLKKRIKMKRNRFFLLSIFLLAFAACSDDSSTGNSGNEEVPEESTVNGISFTLDQIVATRVVDDVFDVGDLIGVQAYDSSGELFEYNDSYSYDTETSSFVSSTPISYEESSKSLSYVATYPALSETAQSWRAYADQTSDIKYELSDLLAAYVSSTTSLTPSLTFYHAMSRVKINLTVTKDGVAYDYSDVKFYASLSQGVDLENLTFAAVEGVAASEITPKQTGDDSYMAVIASQTLPTTDFASILFDGKTVQMELDGIDELTFEAGVSYTYNWSVVQYEGLIEQSLVLVETEIEDWTPGNDLEQDIENAITMDRTYDNTFVALSDGTISIGITRNTDDAKLATIDWSTNDTSIATVDANGTVTLLDFGEVTISADCLGFTDQISFVVPGGFFRELFNTSKTISTVASTARPVSGSYIFGVNSNSKVWDSENETLKITCSSNSTTSKSASVDGVSHTLTMYERADMWCYDVNSITFNPYTYPYLAYHIDDNVAINNVIYQEFTLNYSSFSNSATNAKPVLDSGDGYDNAYGCEVRFFNDNSMMLIFDMSQIITLNDEYPLGSGITDYLTIGTADMNYFMYGYSTATTVGTETYPAMGASTVWNIYSVQTFASLNDIDAYASSLGLSNR